MTKLTYLAIGAAVLSYAMTERADAAKPAKSCTVLASAGSGPTKAIAEIMANGGLKNIAASRGYSPEGKVKLTCKDGTILTECIAQSRICK